MFDRLIESNTAAVVKPRRGYFMVSSIVVGILFLTAVVVSLYAQSIDLGVDEFDTATLLAPVAAEAPVPPEPPAPSSQPQTAQADVPNRHSNMLRPDETPIDITGISTTPNTELSRPHGYFHVGEGIETNNFGGRGVPGGSGTGGPVGTGSVAASQPVNEDNDAAAPPPPPRKPVEKPKLLVSIGVVNGKARSLPKPVYPAPALAVRAQGDVSVQVTIDEEGNVISAHAVSGNPLLRQSAERAAWNAKFTPTLLSNQPVKVTGVIVYKFTQN
jgi:protein TonB